MLPLTAIYCDSMVPIAALLGKKCKKSPQKGVLILVLSEIVDYPGARNVLFPRRNNMFDKLMGLFSTDIAIDLGTANTLVYVRNKGIVINEPSVVAINRNSSRTKVLAVGSEAKRMLGKTPGNIAAIRPMRDGVIADFSITEDMLRYFIEKIHQRKHLVRSRLVVSIPTGITNVERKAVREAAKDAGVREVYLVEQPMAAAIGAGLPVRDARGNMIVDIGGGTTDVAVISLCGMVITNTIKVAGDALDEAIIQFIRRRHGLLIGERTAEQIKMTMGSVCPLSPELEARTMDIKGRDVSGVPRSIRIRAEEVREALFDSARSIVESIKAALENTPPEIAGDIFERGIVLAGGGGQLGGLDKLIRKEVGIPVFIAEDPLLAVVKGVGEVLENLDLYRRLLH